ERPSRTFRHTLPLWAHRVSPLGEAEADSTVETEARAQLPLPPFQPRPPLFPMAPANRTSSPCAPRAMALPPQSPRDAPPTAGTTSLRTCGQEARREMTPQLPVFSITSRATSERQPRPPVLRPPQLQLLLTDACGVQHRRMSNDFTGV